MLCLADNPEFPKYIEQLQATLREAKVVLFDMDGTLYRRTEEMDSIIQQTMSNTLSSIFYLPNTDQAHTDFLKTYSSTEGRQSATTTFTILSEKYFEDLRPQHLKPQDYAQDLVTASQSIPGLGEGLQEALDKSMQNGGFNLTDFSKGLAKAIVNHSLNLAEIVDFIDRDPQIVGMIRGIKASGRSVGIVTSSPLDRTKKILEKLGFNLETDFGLVITSADASKHDGSAYRLIAERYAHIKPEQILMIGDSHDVDVSKANEQGFLGIHIADPLRNGKPSYPSITLTNIEELAHLFRLKINEVE